MWGGIKSPTFRYVGRKDGGYVPTAWSEQRSFDAVSDDDGPLPYYTPEHDDYTDTAFS
jgi:hypothetical protein